LFEVLDRRLEILNPQNSRLNIAISVGIVDFSWSVRDYIAAAAVDPSSSDKLTA
jgi:hypothetical protein